MAVSPGLSENIKMLPPFLADPNVPVPKSPFLHCGAKLSLGAELSHCQIVPRCQIVIDSYRILALFYFHFHLRFAYGLFLPGSVVLDNYFEVAVSVIAVGFWCYCELRGGRQVCSCLHPPGHWSYTYNKHSFFRSTRPEEKFLQSVKDCH